MNGPTIHRFFLTFGLLAFLPAAALFAADLAPQPYTVWAKQADTKVYSGPSNEYYATLHLPAGTQCEVYQQLPEGWLAIRPPVGSFSVVSSSSVEPLAEGVVRVRRDSAASRVGSLLTDKHNAVHVRLDKGESLQLMDAASSDDSPWIKIAPPAGEFRWIRESDFSRQPVSQAATPAPLAPPITTLTSAAVSDQGAWRERAEPVTPIDSVTATSSGSPAKPQPAVTTNSPLPSTAPLTTGTALTIGASTFDQRVDLLEIQLSRRMVGPANLWVFDDIEKKAAQLLSEAATPAQTQTVEQLAARLGRFSQLARRVRTPSNQPIARRQPTHPSPGNLTPISRADENLAGYDAVGLLRPVVSKRGNAPPYALVDERGEVVTFLTPSPSLNLQPYLGQRIGVSGTRSYLPEYRRRNIQTARVAPLGTSRR